MIAGMNRLTGIKKMTVRAGTIFLGFFLATFGASGFSSGADILPVFGQGEIKIILYSDYFCPPCRSMEPDVEPILKDLMKTGKITLTFVDTPTSQFTSLYARYYVYALNANPGFEEALHSRNALFEAAERKIQERTKLEEFLKGKGVSWKTVDVKPAFDFWNNYLRDDNIRSTPTCVVKRGEKKEITVGNLEILKALETLKKEIAEEGKPKTQTPKENRPEGKKDHETSKSGGQ